LFSFSLVLYPIHEGVDGDRKGRIDNNHVYADPVLMRKSAFRMIGGPTHRFGKPGVLMKNPLVLQIAR
jgi:hypothetical protein